MDLKHNLELIEVIKQLLLCENALFIVEGKNDASALVYLGIDSRNILIIAQKSFDDVVLETLSTNKRIIDFIDEDEEGKAYLKRLKSAHIFFDSSFKKKLFYLLNISHTQDISSKVPYSLVEYIHFIISES